MVQFLRLIFRTCNVIKELKNIEATTTELSKATALMAMREKIFLMLKGNALWILFQKAGSIISIGVTNQ